MDEQVKMLKKYMDESSYTVAVTGAGISYMYGMRRFKQDAGDGWTKKVTPGYINSHPDEVYALFKDAFLDATFEKGPSLVHCQMAELEKRGKLQGIVTQNLDYLHETAGSKNVVAFMGSFANNICLDCKTRLDDINIWKQGKMPVCPKCGGYMVPVYFSRFGHRLGGGRTTGNEFMEQAQDMIARAELLIVIGTTGFHSDEYLKKMKKSTKIVQINPGSTMYDQMAVLNIRMDAEKVFDQILSENKEREMRKQKYQAQVKQTLEICQQGSYEKNGKTIQLGLAASAMSRARVLLPDEVHSLPAKEEPAGSTAHCAFSCENKDSLTLAHEKFSDPAYASEDGTPRILLLNLASAVRPGGGVRDGMGGQEEDLCRDSTLLQSLESDAAKPYYEYNNGLHSHLGSDAMIFTPDVVVFRDGKGELLDEPFTVSVLTCAAPNLRFGFEGKSEEEYRKMLYQRIEGIIRCAVYLGYPNLILGAFGCGAFKNDAALVSDDFYQALTGQAGRQIRHADFAVLCTPGKEYNYNEFCRNFSKE